MEKNEPPYCEMCASLIKENKRRAIPHEFLVEIQVEHFKPALVASYSVTTYQCSKCGNKITHMNDRNDNLHWY